MRIFHTSPPGLLLVALCLAPLSAGQTPSPSAPTLDQLQTYEAFRAWITKQPPDIQKAADDVVFQRYASALRGEGKSDAEIASIVDTLEKLGDRAEVERWDQILTSAKPRFNTAPNAFLVEMTKGVKPGRALDLGMGQGRNTIYLAQAPPSRDVVL